ncbi:MAG TPA: MotA/TolQ/ExbB proton channel family protein [bacterium]|nr:MotA/TolQ/ExbB proton channel family protein [bacterium]
MKGWIIYVIMIVAVGVSYAIFKTLPEYIQKGGPLIIALMVLMIMVFTFIIERLWTLKQASGKGDIGGFVRKLKNAVHGGKLDEAIEACRKQGGCLANVVGAGLERYSALQGQDIPQDELIDETRRAFEEANALETPLLERNLIALSTIASIGTMVGLLGTTIGMIRSFKAMGHQGAPDAIQLALGISEALINTAGGLFLAILAIIMYNYFTNRVDAFNYSMDETTFEVLQLLQHQKGAVRG